MTPQVLTILCTGLIVGALTGAWRAKRRKGTRFDILHFTLVHGLIGFLLATFALVIFIRAA